MIVATPAIQRRAIAVQKGALWEFVELPMAAAGVDVDVTWSEVEVSEIVDVGTVPEDVGKTELGGDDVPSDVEVTYECRKNA